VFRPGSLRAAPDELPEILSIRVFTILDTPLSTARRSRQRMSVDSPNFL
jgi:hypothetical protein